MGGRSTMIDHGTETLDLAGRTALVTGGTRGIGRAIAAKLSRSGCDVVLNYAHDEQAAEETLRQLAGSAGKVDAIRADLSRPAEVSRLYAEIERQYGHLDVLVHNAVQFRPMVVPQASPA